MKIEKIIGAIKVIILFPWENNAIIKFIGHVIFFVN